MGTFHVVFGRVNRVFLWPEINELSPDSFGPGKNLIDIASGFDDWTTHELSLLGTMPAGMQEAVRALLAHNLSRDRRMEVHFAWLPASAWKMTVAEDADVSTGEGCPGAITVLLESPLPDDLAALAT
jgi:hypothetical protein